MSRDGVVEDAVAIGRSPLADSPTFAANHSLVAGITRHSRLIFGEANRKITPAEIHGQITRPPRKKTAVGFERPTSASGLPDPAVTYNGYVWTLVDACACRALIGVTVVVKRGV